MTTWSCQILSNQHKSSYGDVMLLWRHTQNMEHTRSKYSTSRLAGKSCQVPRNRWSANNQIPRSKKEIVSTYLMRACLSSAYKTPKLAASGPILAAPLRYLSPCSVCYLVATNYCWRWRWQHRELELVLLASELLSALRLVCLVAAPDFRPSCFSAPSCWRPESSGGAQCAQRSSTVSSRRSIPPGLC